MDASQSTASPFPRVVFGTSSLGNLFRALSDEQRLAMVKSWFDYGGDHIVIDSAGKYGAGLALESLGNCLRELGIPAEKVTIGNKLGWFRVPLTTPEPTFEPGAWVDLKHDAEQRISGEGILQCWHQGNELLGEPYRSTLGSVHDPDEYLAASSDPADKERRKDDLRDAYAALDKLRSAGEVKSIGVGSKDWRVAKELSEYVDFDWVMLANCVTAYTHEQGVLDFIASLAERGVTVINSGVFNAGFLVGGQFFDYRATSPETDAELYRWRDAFNALCAQHDIKPAHACIQFGLSVPGVASVALSSTDPARVKKNVEMANQPLPTEFWDAVKAEGLIDSDYGPLGS